MASVTLSGWPNGATVSAYAVPTIPSRTPDTDALGSAVTSGTASSAGTVTLTGLTAGAAYIASDGTTRRGFIASSGSDATDLKYGRGNGQAGLLAPTALGWVYTALTVVASQARFARFVPSRDMTIGSIAFGVSTAASVDDPCDVGIYTSNLVKIVTAGATSGKLNSTGRKTVPITPTTLKAGTTYYAAMSVGAIGGTAAIVSGCQFTSSIYSQLFGASNGQYEIASLTSGHPLPDPLTVTTIQGTAIALALIEA